MALIWSVEKAQAGPHRVVLHYTSDGLSRLELSVNGESVMKKNVIADGATRDVSFDIPIRQSCWVALRIRASSHTNPIFVIVDKQPVRVKKSIEWCLKGVDQCWSQKESLIDAKEHADAIAAYEHARRVYRERLAAAGE